MDSTKPNNPAPRKSKLAKTFHKVILLKTATKTFSNKGFCLPIPQEQLRCYESQQFGKDNCEDAAKVAKIRAVLEAFIAKLFATISSVKAAYAELQMAQFPYNNEAIHGADQAVVDELKALSELKHSYLKKQIDPSPPHVTLMLAEIQEQQSLMKTYEITMKKLQGEIEYKVSEVSALQKELNETRQYNKTLENKLNPGGSFSILDNVRFSDVNVKDFVTVLNYALRSIRGFVKLLIKEMESANWDIDAAANAIQPGVSFDKRSHEGFAFESFVCKEILNGFHEPSFALQYDHQPLNNGKQRRLFFFEQFSKLKSGSVSHFLRQNQSCLFGKFLKSKYLHIIHPKMEFSFAGNLNQRKMVNSGEFPETDFFKAFAEMGRTVWLLYCLAFSFTEQVSLFQVKKNCGFSEMYMESVREDISAAAAGGDLLVAFTVVPGFRVGRMVVQSQVYLSPAKTNLAKQ